MAKETVDRDVTIRFYELVNNHQGGPPPEQILRELMGKRPRERESDEPGVRLRLEELTEADGLLIGDITRVQTDNLPGHVTDDATGPLPVNEIGHEIAFCYDPETHYIALQFEVKIGIGRVAAYLQAFGGPSEFGHFPVLTKDALARFGRERPKKLTLRIGRVSNFRHAEADTTDFERALEMFGRLFDAPSIEVTIATRGEDNQLDRAETWNTIRRWLGFREKIEGIQAIRAETIESDDAFNFIAQLLKENDTLELPNNAPPKGRKIRMAYAKECYDKHRKYLRGIAGVA